MTTTDLIESDVANLKGYFQRLFSMADEPYKAAPLAPTNDEKDTQFVRHNVTAFIRSDMVCNVYSLVDFWLASLCSFHKRKANLSLSRSDIKGSSDLDVYHKYLTKVALLDLQAVSPNFDHLNFLRKVRNCLIHGGGHVDEQQLQEIANIPGVSVQISLIIISDDFIWKSLNHARAYLLAVAQA